MTNKCRACTSFKDLSVGISKEAKDHPDTNTKHKKHLEICPPTKEVLGNASWLFLHTMASYFPEKPTDNQRLRINRFIGDFADLYPCRYCGEHMSSYINEHPITNDNNKQVAEWTCHLHNEVNELLRKKKFDCNTILESYRYGCDE